MGNSTSSSGRGHHEDSVDYGQLAPQGVYTGPRDWNQSVVTQLIIERKLAPFYRPLEEYEDSWDDEQILAARKEFPDHETAASESSTRGEHGGTVRSTHPHRRPPGAKEQGSIPEAAVYRGAVECPICFLYYPSNINHSRCCDQAICTECFVQIKRSEPTTTHLVSEPAACPYCVQDNFGVTYTPPPWRAGIGADGSGYASHPTTPRTPSMDSASLNATMKARRRSFGHDSKEVVTIDQIRPDWEAKLNAVRAAVTRRANRRIIMRQVGDRLIPVGVTSGRVHPLTGDGASDNNSEGGGESPGEGRTSRRSRRRQQQQQDLNHLLGSMGLGGQDLEELMVMEAMRLSLLEHEEQQRREQAKKNTDGGNQQTNADGEQSSNAGGPSIRSDLPSLPSSAPINSPARDSSSNGSSPSSASSLGVDIGPHQRNRSPTPAVPSPLGPQSLDVPSTLPSRRSIDRSPSPRPRQSSESSRPPPFSTLSAALAATSTATAFLSPSDIPQTEGVGENREQSTASQPGGIPHAESVPARLD
ncbi:hypothetical protein BD410DRAFT_782656 [Rickenella mellea]|uniref:RING-type domain-containing protein n=1 Tax=Rickenella mellea TaxID=50990 RepID=A0A4Y7QKW2_9AGAM|nr:hypothetical protein BD410DRAFT_782656 [Rickenella mellea]